MQIPTDACPSVPTKTLTQATAAFSDRQLVQRPITKRNVDRYVEDLDDHEDSQSFQQSKYPSGAHALVTDSAETSAGEGATINSSEQQAHYMPNSQINNSADLGFRIHSRHRFTKSPGSVVTTTNLSTIQKRRTFKSTRRAFCKVPGGLTSNKQAWKNKLEGLTHKDKRGQFRLKTLNFFKVVDALHL